MKWLTYVNTRKINTEYKLVIKYMYFGIYVEEQDKNQFLIHIKLIV